MEILGLILMIFLWTIVREELLDKYWRYTENKHLHGFGNLYVIVFCIFCSVLISVIFTNIIVS